MLLILFSASLFLSEALLKILIFWRYTNYTVSQKTSHLCLAVTLTHMNGWILIFFGRNVTDKVGNQKAL